MFHSSKKKMVLTAQALIILVFLTIVGCGHDSKSEQSEQNVDPAAVYKGKTSQAIITSENAEYLVRGGYSGLQFEVILDIASRDNFDSPNTNKRFQILPIVQSIKQSAMGIAFSKNKSPSRAATRQASHLEYGRENGTAYFSIDVNDTTGYFTGTVIYEGYNDVGCFIDGAATITGTLDFNTKTLPSMTLSCNALEIYFFDTPIFYGITLTGTYSWDSNIESDTETISINMALLDQKDDKTYWFKSYESVTYYENDVASQVTTTGCFYDHDYGYVDLSASVSLLQSERPFLFSGASGTWTRVLFFSESYEYLIEADTDGDTIVDWEREIVELLDFSSFYKQYQIE